MIHLSDDGTLDTVFRCDQCGEEIRYTFDGEGSYDDFVAWAIQDAEEEHACEGEEDSSVPNLDGMSPDELGKFWARHQRGWKRKYLFPVGGWGTSKATAALANYAINKTTAMSCRARGDIQAAEIYEKVCENIYSALPEWARW
jgi:hypothetical protein